MRILNSTPLYESVLFCTWDVRLTSVIDEIHYCYIFSTLLSIAHVHIMLKLIWYEWFILLIITKWMAIQTFVSIIFEYYVHIYNDSFISFNRGNTISEQPSRPNSLPVPPTAYLLRCSMINTDFYMKTSLTLYKYRCFWNNIRCLMMYIWTFLGISRVYMLVIQKTWHDPVWYVRVSNDFAIQLSEKHLFKVCRFRPHKK